MKTHLHKHQKDQQEETHPPPTSYQQPAATHQLPPTSQPTIQTKLTLGAIGDRYEQEADNIANQINNNLALSQPHSQTNPTVQRATLAPPTASTTPVNPSVETAINQARGGGQPLAEQVRQPMEQAFGADFSHVRVHTDQQADELNQSLQARAFTTGRDIFFRQGQSTDTQLLAHELTHIVQQNSSPQAPIQRKETVVSTESGGITLVKFDHNEQPPESDLYTYEPAGTSTTGDLYRRHNKSYQVETPTAASSTRSYGTTTTQQSSSITYNPSLLFPEAMAKDKRYYGRREGFSALIEQTDIDDLYAHRLAKLQKRITEKAKTSGAQLGARVKQRLFGDGVTPEEEANQRLELVRTDFQDPTVLHYMLVHEESMARKLISKVGNFGLGKATAGISALILGGFSLAKNLKLAQALSSKIKDLEQQYIGSHGQTGTDTFTREQYLLIARLKFLRKKIHGSAISEAASKIPGLEGAADTVADQASSRGINKYTGDPAQCVQEIIDLARQGTYDAYALADLLGIPHEIFTAEGGDAVVMMRLGK